MHYKVYDVGESIQIDIHLPGSDEKTDQYILPKNILNEQVMELHNVIQNYNESTNTLNADLLNTIVHAITEHKEKKIIENVSKSVASDIDVYKR